MKQTNSNVKVNVIDNRKNGGNYKWQIEKIDVILDFFNDDFFNDYPNVKVEVIVNNKEVFPKMIVDGVAVFPDYIRYFKAFSKSKKEMVEEMNYMVEMMNNELNNNMEENNMNTEMMNALVNDFNDYVVSKVKTDYKNAVDSTIDAYSEVFVDGESEYVCGGFEYDYDIRKMWVDYVLNEREVYDISKNDLYDYYDEDMDDFISVADLDNIVERFENSDDVSYGECLIWVKNPHYNAEINDTPYLDDVERVVKVIKDYVINYEGMLMDYNGFSASMCVPWDVFNEDDMKMLIEDEMFEVYVSQYLMMTDIYDMLVYDDGVYVSVDAKKFNKVA